MRGGVARKEAHGLLLLVAQESLQLDCVDTDGNSRAHQAGRHVELARLEVDDLAVDDLRLEVGEALLHLVLHLRDLEIVAGWATRSPLPLQLADLDEVLAGVLVGLVAGQRVEVEVQERLELRGVHHLLLARGDELRQALGDLALELLVAPRAPLEGRAGLAAKAGDHRHAGRAAIAHALAEAVRGGVGEGAAHVLFASQAPPPADGGIATCQKRS